MQIGTLADLKKTYPNPAGGQLQACFMGSQLLKIPPEAVRLHALQFILITATKELERQLTKFTVNGMFETGNNEYDGSSVIMSLSAAEQFTKSGGAVTGLNVRLDDYRNANAVRAALQAKFESGRTLRSFAGITARRVALSADGARLAVVAADGQVVVYQVNADTELRRLPAGNAPATAAALSSDGALLLVGRKDGSAVLLKTDSGDQVQSVPATGSPVTSVAFSADDYNYALGRADGSAGVCEPETAGEPVALKGNTRTVADVAFNADGDKVATACGDGTARIYDVADGRLRRTVVDKGGEPVTAVALSPDGGILLMGQAKGIVQVVDAKTGLLMADGAAGSGPVLTIRFGPGSGAFMTATAGNVRHWALETTEGHTTAPPTFTVSEPGPHLRSVAFADSVQEFVSVAGDGVPLLRYSGPQFSVKTWEEQSKTFMDAVKMEGFLQGLILSFILVLAEFFIFALVSTMVSEKRRDIGIMKALGFSSRQVSTVFLVIGLAIGFFGAIFGVVGGVLFATYIDNIRVFIRNVTGVVLHGDAALGFDPFPAKLYYFKKIPSHVTLESVLVFAGGAILCALIFSIIPAIRAARMEPVRTLHYE